MAVTIRSVVGLTRAIPENPQETARAGSSETIRQPSRANRDEEMVRSLRRRKEVGRNVRPADENVQLVRSLSNSISEIPCRVSSDLHEWRNDLGTVSTGDSAKLQYE